MRVDLMCGSLSDPSDHFLNLGVHWGRLSKRIGPGDGFSAKADLLAIFACLVAFHNLQKHKRSDTRAATGLAHLCFPLHAHAAYHAASRIATNMARCELKNMPTSKLKAATAARQASTKATKPTTGKGSYRVGLL